MDEKIDWHPNDLYVAMQVKRHVDIPSNMEISTLIAALVERVTHLEDTVSQLMSEVSTLRSIAISQGVLDDR